MTGKNTYWITTANGVYAQVAGAEERDRWTPRGWEQADEPGPTDFVYMRKEGLEQPAQFAYGAAETWQAMGWEFTAPPEPVDVTKDPAVFAQEQADRSARTKATAESKTASDKQPAAGADKNTKE